MTVANTNIVDWLGLERATGHVIVTVVDDLDWNDEKEHLSLLQTKLNTYLAFIESGEVFERLREDLGRDVPTNTPIRVNILAKYAMPFAAKEFFEYARTLFSGAGFELTFKLVVAPS